MIKKFKITGLFGFRNVDINFENCYDITQPEPERMVTQTFTYNRYEDDRRNANAGGIANGW